MSISQSEEESSISQSEVESNPELKEDEPVEEISEIITQNVEQKLTNHIS
jgi:hypothetical protein